MVSKSGFILSEEINTLLGGSYEVLSRKIEKAVREDRKKLFGSDSSVSLLGTFKDYAIIQTESQDIYRVKYEVAANKDIVPISAEPLSIKKYTPDQYAVNEAKAFIDAYFSGSKTSAGEHFKRLFPVVQERKASVPASKLVEAFENLVKGSRPWKSIYQERVGLIKESLSESISGLESNSLKVKFRKLYDGSTPAEQLENYRSLVTSDLKYLGERIQSLESTTREAVKNYDGAVPALKSKATDETIKLFESFSRDYLEDLSGVSKLFSESTEVINKVDDLGKVYDLLVSEISRYEVAGHFVQKMSSGLTATEEK